MHVVLLTNERKYFLKTLIYTTLFLFRKKKTCAKRKTEIRFLVEAFTKPLQGLRGRGAELHKGKKVV
jgi:hypothetical protein